MPVTGGVNVIVTSDIATEVAQQLVCWDKDADGNPAHTIEYRTDGNLPYFRIPAGSCAGKDPLTLMPGGATIACNDTGAPTVVEPTPAEVSGVNPNTCEAIDAPTGLAVTGAPAQTSITVHWTAPATYTPTGYRVGYKKDADTTYTYVEVAAGTTTATVNGLTASTTYNFHVQARNGTYLSPATADVDITTAT